MKPSVPVILLFLLCGVFVFAAAIDVRAAELVVTKVDDTSDGVCDGDCSLREAVVAAVSGDTVVFSPLFNTPKTITLTLGQITIDKNLTITGTGQTLTTISGNNASRIFFINGNSNIIMSGMKLRDGKVETEFSAGGAILIIGGSLNLTGMEFTNNTAFHKPSGSGAGGAIGGSDCTMTLTNLYVHHNFSPSATIGVDPGVMTITDSVIDDNRGGIYAQTLNAINVTVTNSSLGINGNFLTVTNSTVTGNGRGIAAGAGMSVDNTIISGSTDSGLTSAAMNTISGSVISNNVSFDLGGGIWNGGTMHLIDSAIVDNEASFNGGGIATFGPLFITNSTVSGNIAYGALSSDGCGGGIYVYNIDGRLTLTNSTVTNNQSKGGGGGGIKRANGQPLIVRNSIIAGNTSTQTNEEDVSGIFTSQGNNLIGNTTGSSGWIKEDLLDVNPLLGPLADNGGGTMTHALLPGSPAINAGNNTLAIDPQTQTSLTNDQRGFHRFVANIVDIGAFEVQPVITGTITYGNTIGSPTPRLVSSVLLSAVGSPSIFVTTSAAGTYTLGGFGTGAYTVTPSKTGDANGISSFDAGLIAKHVAGIIPLTGNQLIVADVSANGTISSFDAGQIARYTVGINGFGSSGNWIFVPVNRTYLSVNSTITGEDFIALLMGDVSGNWIPAMSDKTRGE